MLVLLLPIVSVVLALAALLLRRKTAERERALKLALESAGRAARLARRDVDAWYRSLIDNAADVITVLEADGTIRYQTPSIEDVLGFPPAALLGTNLLDTVHPEDRAWALTQFRGARAHAGAIEGSSLLRWRHRDGSYRWIENKRANLLADPAVNGIVLNSRDVTDRVVLEEQLTQRAFHDSLTGLANRALFVDRLEHALYAGTPQDERLAVLFIDLDDFKRVNDSLGHSAGDELLRVCARRLTERLAAGDTVARLGGDEYAVLLESCATPEAAGQMARYLIDALAEPLELHGRRIAVSASAGIALVNRRQQPPTEEVLRNADIALYRAKDEGAAATGSTRSACTPRCCAGSSSRPSCAGRSRPTSSCCTTSRSSRPPAGWWWAPRRWCAGSIRRRA